MADFYVAQVHRFGDSVACHVGKGETTYLTPKAALALARALTLAARSVRSVEFTKSTVGTQTVRQAEQPIIHVAGNRTEKR